MKVESVSIKNFKAISEEKLEINGNNVYVLGQNAVGKSSFLDAIFKVLSGKDLPSKVVKDGENSGEVVIDLGDIIVKAKFTTKDEKVSVIVESKDGARFPSPRKMLDEKAGIIDFDINSFFAMTPKKQVDFIKQLAGVDFSDLDEEYKKNYDERTFVNRRVKELEAQQVFFDKTKTEKIDISELMDQVGKAMKVNSEIDNVVLRIKDRTDKIAQLKAEISQHEELNIKANKWLSENKKIETEGISDQISKAESHNSEVDNTIKGQQLAADLKDVTDKQEKLNTLIANIEGSKRTAISESVLPVKGLTFDEDQLYYNGLPFEKAQINTAQQIIIGLEINKHLLKDIQIARFDGSLLDNKNIEIVEAWAKENGLQLFVEFVDRNTETLKLEIKK